MSKIEVYWVKMFGGELDAVMGLLNGKQVVLIYDDSVQSGSNIYGDLASVEETLDCVNQAIALYKKGPEATSAA